MAPSLLCCKVSLKRSTDIVRVVQGFKLLYSHQKNNQDFSLDQYLAGRSPQFQVESFAGWTPLDRLTRYMLTLRSHAGARAKESCEGTYAGSAFRWGCPHAPAERHVKRKQGDLLSPSEALLFRWLACVEQFSTHLRMGFCMQQASLDVRNSMSGARELMDKLQVESIGCLVDCSYHIVLLFIDCCLFVET